MKYLLLLSFLLHFNLFSSPLVIWTSSEDVRDAINAVSKNFENDFKVKVQVDILNKDLTTQFKTAALSGKGPDVLAWAHDVVGELAESGFLESIKLPKNESQHFLPVSIDAFTYKGHLYGYPYAVESVAFIYNKKLLADVPKSMDEFIASCPELKLKNKYCFLYDLGNFFFSFPFLSAGGGYVFKITESGINVSDVGLANHGAIAGGKFIRSLVTDNIVPSSTDRSIAISKMIKGELLATIDGPWAIAELVKSGIDIGVSPIPMLFGNIPRPFVGSHGLLIRKSSPNKELAKEFIEKYVLSKNGMLALYKKNPRAPSRIDIVSELSKHDPFLAPFMKSASTGIPMPNVPEMGAVWGAMGNALQLILSGQTSIAKALNDAKGQIETSVQK